MVTPNYYVFWDMYTETCRNQDVTPTRTDFFGFLYGLANGNTPKDNSAKYSRV